MSRVIVPSIGPKDAKIVLIGESPAAEEVKQGVPLVGPSGQMLNKALVKAGINRNDCYICNLVPIRAPGDKFASHNPADIAFGRERLFRELSSLRSAKVFVPLGANPLEWLCGTKPPVALRGESKREGFITSWRGSIIPVSLNGDNVPENYLRTGFNGSYPAWPVANRNAAIIPTFHPAAVLRQFQWSPWFIRDLTKAGEVSRNGIPEKKFRRWFYNNPTALSALADSDVDIISVDSELNPYIIGIATEDEVHVFEFGEVYRPALTKLLQSPWILKVAHRWLHDYAFLKKVIGIEPKWPLFDTVGGSMLLNNALEKQLSPHIASMFTDWPYHKWLANVDMLTYCGMDAVVCYDAYWPMLDQLASRKLLDLIQVPGAELSPADHDHKLLYALMDMQSRGFMINEAARVEVACELSAKLAMEEAALSVKVQPVIDRKIKQFKKPHLFKVPRKCDCCGGGKIQAAHCDRCNVGHPERSRKENIKIVAELNEMTQKAVVESWNECVVCTGTGKIVKDLPFNPDSPDQLADVIYRGLSIRPRRYKGAETIRAAQLESLREDHPLVDDIVHLSKTRADYDTVARLKPGADGALHCEFDPWGTASFRVAGKEGLIEPGTNPMNLPKEARKFVVPRPGFTLLYPDMAQVEARAVAVASGDKTLIKALYEPIPERGNNPDYHTFLLNAIHDYDGGINLSRDQSKRVSYAGFYGARPAQLAKELTAEAIRKGKGMMVDEAMAAKVLAVLYRICPGIPHWQQACAEEVLRSRRLVNPFTKHEFWWLGHIVDKDNKGELDYEIKKQVWSRIPQDIGAWVLGRGIINLHASPHWGSLINPLIHVHDGLLIESPLDRISEAEEVALSYLSQRIWGMDFPAEMKRGSNWYEAS